MSYALEYGEAEIEISDYAIRPGEVVLVHDDILATGGTAAAAASLAVNQGALVKGFSFLSELAILNGRDRLVGFSTDIETILNF